MGLARHKPGYISHQPLCLLAAVTFLSTISMASATMALASADALASGEEAMRLKMNPSQ